MDQENKNINPESAGKIEGFDRVENSNEGYTVTPDGGFYTKTHNQIIQDNIYTSPNVNSKAEDTEAHRSNYSYEYKNNYNYLQKPKKVKKEKKRYSAGVVILSSVLAALLGFGGSIAAMIFVNNFNDDAGNVIIAQDDNQTSNIKIDIEETEMSVAEAVALKVTPSVVGIRTTTSVTSFFGGSSESSGEGSGVIYSSDGYIITNYHVISEATGKKTGDKIEVFIDSDTSTPYQATVVGYNISADLAVIKINVKGLNAIEIGDSDSLKVGQYVITVGNPGGLEFMDSVTSGIISGLNREVSADSGMKLIQTDAAINPGNSGGALVDTEGKLIGINSSKIVSEEFEGMGFAIPSKTVKEICDNIISRENASEPYLGISISEKYTANVLKYYGYPVGAVVLSVVDNSPADAAGIKKGDIITAYNGNEITEYSVLEDLIRNSTPNETVSIKLYRSGRYYNTDITVGSNS